MPDTVTPTLRAAIYARVSSDEQREGQTIDSQITELERFANSKGWAIAGVYKDDGWSGALLGRPALDSLRDDAAHKQFDLVLFNDVDRLARDVAHLGIVKRDLERSGVKVIFRKLPSEESPTNNLMVNVLGSFAEFEREMIADRTRRGRRHKVEVRQQFIGTLAAYGYRYVPKDKASGHDGYLAVVPEEAVLVRQMFEWVDREGLSAQKVVDRLNNVDSRPRKGGTWAKSTVLRILRNETYSGIWHYNKHYSSESLRVSTRNRYKRSLKNSSRLRPRSEWIAVVLPPELQIVPRDLWQRVQQQLTKNIMFSPRNTKHLYLLQGLVRCGGCGGTYTGDPCHGKFYYRCHKRCKNMRTVKEEHLDDTVWGALSEVVLNPATIFKQANLIFQKETENERISNAETEVVNRGLTQIRKEETRLLEAYRNGIISPGHLGQELEQLKQRQSALELRKGHLEHSAGGASRSNVQRSLEEYFQATAKRLQSFNKAERQRFIRLLIENVIFEGDRVRIRAIIPLNETEQAIWSDESKIPKLMSPGEGIKTPLNEPRNDYMPIRIEDTMKDYDGRKPVISKDRIAATAIHHEGRNQVEGENRITNMEAYLDGRKPVAGKDRIEDTVTHYDGLNSVSGDMQREIWIEKINRTEYVGFEFSALLPQQPFSILSDDGLKLIHSLKKELGDPTLHELRDRVFKEQGIQVSVTHISRALKRLGLSSIRRGPRPISYQKAA